MEATKRTYQKHKTEKKITVKHYINDTITELDKYGEIVHPIYFQVIFDKKNTKIRSRIFSLHESTKNMSAWGSHFQQAIDRDIVFIKYLITKYIDNDFERFSFKDLPQLYHCKLFELSAYIDHCLNNEISYTIRRDEENGFFTPDSKPLIWYQFVLDKLPEVSIVKDNFSSQIWYFDLLLFQMRRRDIFGKGYNPFKEDRQNSFRFLNPTLLDFTEGYFQKTFKDFFGENQMINDLINDINKLVTRYSSDFFTEFITVKS